MADCGCCGAKGCKDWDGLYGCCGECAFCQSLGQCYEGEDKPENTTCCHGRKCGRRDGGEVSDIGYALLIHPDDAETPVESLRVQVMIELDHYSQDPFEVIAKARRIPDRHVAKGDAYLIIAGNLTL